MDFRLPSAGTGNPSDASIQSVAPESARIVRTIRISLRKRLPAAHEIVYEHRSWFVISYSPTVNGYDGVKLYSNRCKSLPDPDKLLQGSGTQTRFITAESASALTRPPFTRLIDQAITDAPVTFAPDGKGTVLIRTASLKKPRRKTRV